MASEQNWLLFSLDMYEPQPADDEESGPSDEPATNEGEQ